MTSSCTSTNQTCTVEAVGDVVMTDSVSPIAAFDEHIRLIQNKAHALHNLWKFFMRNCDGPDTPDKEIQRKVNEKYAQMIGHLFDQVATWSTGKSRT